jgi:CRISPR-associated protein Csm4
MKIYRVVLTPTSSIDEIPASDRLFGAICWGIRAVYSEKNLCEILDRFDGDDPAFVLSSSFPMLKNDGKAVHFYPMLCLPGPGLCGLKGIARECSESGLAFKVALTRAVEHWERFSKARFVSHTVTERFLVDGNLEGAFKDYHSGGAVKLVSQDLLMSQEDYALIFGDGRPPRLQSTEITQRNRIDRLLNSTGGAGELYYTTDTRLRIGPEGPRLILHFLLKTSDVDFLRPVFRWLADTGIGGNRTSGKNHFSLSEPEEANVPDASGNVFFTLSRCLPKSGEEPLMYNLLPRRNRLESSHFRGPNINIWKRKVIYFREGSCFRYHDRKQYYGRVQEVIKVDDRSIRQNGLAFPIFGSADERNEAED